VWKMSSAFGGPKIGSYGLDCPRNVDSTISKLQTTDTHGVKGSQMLEIQGCRLILSETKAESI
jgi:hypothetical protein